MRGWQTYAEFVFHGDRASAAQSLGYSDAEYAWAIANEVREAVRLSGFPLRIGG